MKTPKVTVVIPNYNHAKYLSKRIESVLNQTYSDFEVLYLDDASTDSSDQVFARYQNDPRIRFLLNHKNSGSAFKQWNKGVQEARGQYIWLAEADDFADPRLLETLVPLLDENPDVVIAFCKSRIVNEQDEQIPPPYAEAYADDPAWKKDFVMAGQEFNHRFMVHINSIPNASAVVFRKAVYEKAGGAHGKLRLAGDWLTWFEMSKQGDIAYVAQPLNFFRAHLSNVRSRSGPGGLWVEEKYRASLYIAKNLTLSAQELEEVRLRCMENWQHAIYHREIRVGWQRGARIFRLARRLDRRVAGRFARHTLYRWLRVTPLFGAARSLGCAVLRVFSMAKA